MHESKGTSQLASKIKIWQESAAKLPSKARTRIRLYHPVLNPEPHSSPKDASAVFWRVGKWLEVLHHP